MKARRWRDGLCAAFAIVVWGAAASPVRAQPAWERGELDGATDEDRGVEGDEATAAARQDSGDWGGFENVEDVERDDRSEPPDSGPAVLGAALSAGYGVGTRALRWPSAPTGPSRTEVGPFMAVDVQALIHLTWNDARRVGLQVLYQTSVGLELDEQRVAGEVRTLDARAHHVVAGLFVDFLTSELLTFRTALGYEARNFRTLVPDAVTPRYTISGPLLQLGLELALFSQRLTLRLQPEVQAILQVGEELREVGIQRPGLAGGGQAAVALALRSAWTLEVAYYESRARVASTGGAPAFRDDQRFATLRLRGEL